MIQLFCMYRLPELELLEVLDISVNPLEILPEGIFSLSKLLELNLLSCDVQFPSNPDSR